MRNWKTPHPPLFNIGRPVQAKWTWVVTYRVASSGYATECHVAAHADDPRDPLDGTASCSVRLGDDLREVIECLAIESMLAACEPTLTGEPPHRRVVFSTNL